MARGKWLTVVSLVAVLGLVSCSAGSSLGAALSPTRALAQDKGVELTVYNSDLALVKDNRQMTLDSGLNLIRFSDVASGIDPTSVHFRSLTDPEGTVVLEQNYEYDVVGSSRLLQKYLDNDITLVMGRSIPGSC